MKRNFSSFSIFVARLYFIFLFGWAILRALFGDRWAFLFLLNAFAPYLFAPLPIVSAIALGARRRDMWLGSALSAMLAIFLYGELFVPKSKTSNEPALTVMTYNILGLNEDTSAIVSAIRAANADVIAIQELNPTAARAFAETLRDEYPYQILNPQPGFAGMGLLSRYPLRAMNATLPGKWTGAPIIATLEWRGATIALVNVHPAPTIFRASAYLAESARVEQTIRERERAMETLAQFCAAQTTPVILLGDFNTAEQSAAYQILARELTDAWRAAGWGLGHTFPLPDHAGDTRWHFAGITLPTRMMRIDFIFHSRDWQTVSARIGPLDGKSDHHSVVARLILTRK
ncbi:MAG: endonuclease/exonuclease/phosphatase family protein [Chloroflexi bacterium]|nr:endonuclease/exonuclease/phosphatase family protein [Chloroflexota bacterium]